jgi:hypothetical protein
MNNISSYDDYKAQYGHIVEQAQYIARAKGSAYAFRLLEAALILHAHKNYIPETWPLRLIEDGVEEWG